MDDLKMFWMKNTRVADIRIRTFNMAQKVKKYVQLKRNTKVTTHCDHLQ